MAYYKEKIIELKKNKEPQGVWGANSWKDSVSYKGFMTTHGSTIIMGVLFKQY